MRLLVHGDSIAAHCPWGDLLGAEVVNRAVVGAKVRDLPGQLDATRADVAVVSIGANDALNLGVPLQLDALAPVLQDLAGRCGDVLVFRPQFYFVPWEWKYRPVVKSRLLAIQSHFDTQTDAVSVSLPVWCWRRDGVHLNRHGNARLAGTVRDRARCPR